MGKYLGKIFGDPEKKKVAIILDEQDAKMLAICLRMVTDEYPQYPNLAWDLQQDLETILYLRKEVDDMISKIPGKGIA